MTIEEFRRITKTGNFVAWQNECEKETIAIAYMAGEAWFNEAINCVRDGQMGKKDEDGVYERTWAADSVYIDECPRLATESEIYLYLHKIGGLRSALGMDDEKYNALKPALIDNKVVYHYKPTDFQRGFNQLVHAKVNELVDELLTKFWKDFE